MQAFPRYSRQGVPVLLATYEGSTSKGEPVGVLAGFLAHEKSEWTILTAAEMNRFEQERDEYLEMIRQISFLSEEEAGQLEPPRVSLLEAPAGSTWEKLASEHLNSGSAAERLAFYNGLDPDAPVPPGALIKIPPSLLGSNLLER